MYTERNTTHTAMKQTKWSSPLKSRCALSLFGWGRLQHWWKATSPILIGSWRGLLATELLPIILVALFDIHDLLVGVFRDQGKRNWLVLCGVQNVLPSPGIFHNVGQKRERQETEWKKERETCKDGWATDFCERSCSPRNILYDGKWWIGRWHLRFFIL